MRLSQKNNKVSANQLGHNPKMLEYLLYAPRLESCCELSQDPVLALEMLSKGAESINKEYSESNKGGRW